MAKIIKNRIYPPMYQAWCNMKSRCDNPNYTNYQLWGGRGISYDSRWKIFENFAEDMYSTYKKGLTLDRIDNNSNYSKENCRWATRKEQNNNRRDNVLIEYKGISDTLLNWANYFKIKRSALAQRIYVYKWSIERALTQEVEVHA
jgi:hypothetical protein